MSEFTSINPHLQDSSSTREVWLGTAKVSFPSEYLQELSDSNHLLDDPAGLRKELAENGYLFIRGFHDTDDVRRARLAVLEYIKNSGPEKLDNSQPWESGVLNSRCGHGCIPSMEGVEPITHHKLVKQVLEGRRPRDFFRRLFGEEATTFGYKWLRGVHRRAYTGAHVDRVYMGRGTDELLTLWTPFDSVPVHMGTLAVCEGSNSLPSFSHLQHTYGDCDIEQAGLEGSGWFTHDPLEVTRRFGGQWKTADFQMGDVLIFTIRTVHMSTANLTDKVRISCDTRWLPASQPMDERYREPTHDFQEKKFGLNAEDSNDKSGQVITMSLLKEKWGFK